LIVAVGREWLLLDVEVTELDVRCRHVHGALRVTGLGACRGGSVGEAAVPFGVVEDCQGDKGLCDDDQHGLGKERAPPSEGCLEGCLDRRECSAPV